MAVGRVEQIEVLHEYDLDAKNREIYLFGREEYMYSMGTNDEGGPQEEPGIDYSIASRFIRNLNLLQSQSDADILVHMKSNGGDMIEGMAIYDAIKACPAHITIINYTHARSMTSIIFQAADRRVMMPHSHFMFHDGMWGMQGVIRQVRAEFYFMERSDTMIPIYIESMLNSAKFAGKKPGKLRKYLRKRMDKKEDVYLTAEEAIEWGFADETFTEWTDYRS